MVVVERAEPQAAARSGLPLGQGQRRVRRCRRRVRRTRARRRRRFPRAAGGAVRVARTARRSSTRSAMRWLTGSSRPAIRTRHALGRMWRERPELARTPLAPPIVVVGQMRVGNDAAAPPARGRPAPCRHAPVQQHRAGAAQAGHPAAQVRAGPARSRGGSIPGSTRCTRSARPARTRSSAGSPPRSTTASTKRSGAFPRSSPGAKRAIRRRSIANSPACCAATRP